MERPRQYLIYRIAAVGEAFTHIRIASPVTLPGNRRSSTFIDEPARAVYARVQWLRHQIQIETDEIKHMVGESGERRQKRKRESDRSCGGEQASKRLKPTPPAGPPPPHLLKYISKTAVAPRWASAEDELKAAICQQFADACAHGR